MAEIGAESYQSMTHKEIASKAGAGAGVGGRLVSNQIACGDSDRARREGDGRCGGSAKSRSSDSSDGTSPAGTIHIHINSITVCSLGKHEFPLKARIT